MEVLLQQRRPAQECTYSDSIFDENMPTTTTQAAFLANSKNKMRLIQALREKMLMTGIRVKQAEADANTLIVSTALAVAESEQVPVVVVGTDTDILVMLVARATASTDMHTLCRCNPVTVFNIQEIQDGIGDTKNHLMFFMPWQDVTRSLRSVVTASVKLSTWSTRKGTMTCLIPSHILEAPTTKQRELSRLLFSSFMGPVVLKPLMTTVTLHTSGQSVAVRWAQHFGWNVYLQRVLQQNNTHTAPVLQCKNGWVTLCLQQNGPGNFRMEFSHL